jgi:hypothetical protein
MKHQTKQTDKHEITISVSDFNENKDWSTLIDIIKNDFPKPKLKIESWIEHYTLAVIKRPKTLILLIFPMNRIPDENHLANIKFKIKESNETAFLDIIQQEIIWEKHKHINGTLKIICKWDISWDLNPPDIEILRNPLNMKIKSKIK